MALGLALESSEPSRVEVHRSPEPEMPKELPTEVEESKAAKALRAV